MHYTVVALLLFLTATAGSAIEPKPLAYFRTVQIVPQANPPNWADAQRIQRALDF